MLGDLGIRERLGKRALDTLVSVLAPQNRLIILDNCEHVIDGAAAVADALLRNCPDITLLTTSREPLRIEGEVTYRVPSLSLPPEHVDERSDLAGLGAVALFVERAAVQAPGFELSDDDAPLVAAICRQLDGMPLALELATARLRSMSLTQMHDRLEQRFGLLTGGSRTLPCPRHQTLRALVDWSYDLLTDAERALMRRASIFVDGFDLEAAEAVCALDDIARVDIADLLASLVDKSLVIAELPRERPPLPPAGDPAPVRGRAPQRSRCRGRRARSRAGRPRAQPPLPGLRGTGRTRARRAASACVARPAHHRRVEPPVGHRERVGDSRKAPTGSSASSGRCTGTGPTPLSPRRPSCSSNARFAPLATTSPPRRVEGLHLQGGVVGRDRRAARARRDVDRRGPGPRGRRPGAGGRCPLPILTRCLAQGGRDEGGPCGGRRSGGAGPPDRRPGAARKVLFQYASVLDEADAFPAPRPRIAKRSRWSSNRVTS